jgi:hypothetical protein
MKSNFPLNSLKGRIAEYLIQDLFIHSGYNVFNYGIERQMPGITKQLNFKKHTPTAKALRHMPDFVVQSILTGNLFYLEVKFRASGIFALDKMYDDYPYRNAWFVIVSPNKIQGILYKRLKEGYEVTPATNYLLENIKSFHIDKDRLQEYKEYAKQLFMAFEKKEK